MRSARAWFAATFNPQSVEDIRSTVGGERSGYYRMVTSDWDMACSLVNHGAIDGICSTMQTASMFSSTRNWSLLSPGRAGGNPRYRIHLEQLVTRMPEANSASVHARNIEVARRGANKRQGRSSDSIEEVSCKSES